MSVFILQIIAMITMFCDHFAIAFLDNDIALRSIGRFAYPIYAFLLAEGFRHIKGDNSRITSHLGWYIVLAVISEPGYDLLEAKSASVADMMATQNVIFTLLLGFLGLLAIERFKNDPLFKYSTILLTAMANFFLLSNFKFVGVLLIYAFYFYLENNTNKSYFKRLSWLLIIFAFYIPLYHWTRYNFCSPAIFIEKLNADNILWYITHIFIACLLATYVGKLGFYNKKFKSFYKFFYPAHLLVLGSLKRIL